MFRKVQRTVETPQLQFIDGTVDVLVVMQRQVLVHACTTDVCDLLAEVKVLISEIAGLEEETSADAGHKTRAT